MNLRLPSSSETRTPGRRIAAWSLVPVGLLGGFLGGRSLRAPRDLPLPPALDGEMLDIHIPFGRLTYYKAGPSEGLPLLLIHSVNAAANSYEMKPLYDHYARHRPVFALDLPGFGFSERQDCIYTPRLMTDAIHAMLEAIRERHGFFPIDAIALSLSSEFLARAAHEHPTMFRSLGLISPTGLETHRERRGHIDMTYGKAGLRDVLTFPLWRRAVFDGLVSRPSLRFFLQKTWGSKHIDEGLLDYDYLAAHQAGAEHAPFSFLAGFLFSRNVISLYKDLSMPVWMGHGIRGDFVDYGRKREVADKANWTAQVFRTGAMPHFERLETFIASYDAFLDRLA
jgi:pimeloyl-ACP methyl ester carboxylesterase